MWALSRAMAAIEFNALKEVRWNMVIELASFYVLTDATEEFFIKTLGKHIFFTNSPPTPL